MAKKKRYQRVIASAAKERAAVDTGPEPEAYYRSGYDGASFSPSRGQIFWPTLETRHELDQFSRTEIQRRVRWLFANVGLVRGLVRNSANLVGGFTIQPRTADADFNARAREVVREQMGRRENFDLGRKYSLRTAQPMLSRCKLKDGDILTVFTGDRRSGGKVAFYESHQLSNPSHASDNWHDGILIGKHGDHLAYGIRAGKAGKVRVIPAGACHYHGSCDVPGHVRAVPPLAHAVNHAIDITEVWGFTKGAIKTSSLFGSVIENDASEKVPRSRQGMTGAPRTDTRSTTETSSPRFQMEEVYEGRQIQELSPGQKMKILQDGRPHPNQQAFWEVLIRDISVGFGLPPEVVWQMAKLTGPGVRFVMDLADRWIKSELAELEQWAERAYFWTIGMEISAGRLPMPKDDPRWWLAKMTPQRNLTIDRGQVSRARLEEIDAGVGTWESWDELDGEFWEDRTEQRVREYAYAKAECEKQGLTYEEVFGRRQGMAAMQSGDDAEEIPDDDDDDPLPPEDEP